jgi:DNA-directed RNA polymerase specialized sigma54-like protein
MDLEGDWENSLQQQLERNPLLQQQRDRNQQGEGKKQPQKRQGERNKWPQRKQGEEE